MHQAELFDRNGFQLRDVVNVAAVPKRSPFRYPGGKTWLIPQIRNWIKSQSQKPEILIEPFAGGGIVGLTAAAESLVDHVIMSELDDNVAAVWNTIIYGDAEWLMDRIVTFVPQKEFILEVLNESTNSEKELAFQTILRNRVSHGGILAPGAGLIKNGENGKGISSRWYPLTLKNRILSILSYRNKITFLHSDGLDLLNEYSTNSNVIFFVDPPYTAIGKKAGKRLYQLHELNHRELFRLCKSLTGDMLLTYENSAGMQNLAEEFSFQYKHVAMNNTHHATMNELLIGRDLSWAK